MGFDFRFPTLPSTVEVRVADNREELAGAFGLVYRCYLKRGYIPPNPAGIIYREAFGLSSSRTLVAVDQERRQVLGTLTVVGDSPLGLDLDKIFPQEVGAIRAEGRKIAELTCLAIRPTHRLGPRAVFFKLTQFAMHYAFNMQYDDVLLAIHPRHYRFYWQVFRASPLGPSRPHPSARGNPAICGRIEARDLRINMTPTLRAQYFDSAYPTAHYTGPPLHAVDHQYFLARAGVPSAGLREAA